MRSPFLLVACEPNDPHGMKRQQRRQMWRRCACHAPPPPMPVARTNPRDDAPAHTAHRRRAFALPRRRLLVAAPSAVRVSRPASLRAPRSTPRGGFLLAVSSVSLSHRWRCAVCAGTAAAGVARATLRRLRRGMASARTPRCAFYERGSALDTIETTQTPMGETPTDRKPPPPPPCFVLPRRVAPCFAPRSPPFFCSPCPPSGGGC